MNSKERHIRRYEKRKRQREERKKSHYKSFEDVYNFYNLYIYGKKSCCGTRWKTSTINFETLLLTEVTKLCTKINKPYKYEGFTYFQTIEHGKVRDIHALSIRDRTIQRCFCEEIMTDNYAKSYISENSASLKNKGYLYAINTITKQLSAHYKKHGLNGGIYQFDFKSYFASIPHDKAIEHLKRYITNDKLTDIGINFINEFDDMHNAEQGYGVGLGSPVSQNIALEFANIIDHYIKDKLHIKGYGRYMDDGYVISESIDVLKKVQKDIAKLVQDLGIKINPKKDQIIPFKHHSFTFLKIRFRLTDTGKVLRKLNRNSIKSIRRKLYIFRRWLNSNKLSIEDIAISYQSWRGHAKRFNCYRTLLSTDKLFINLFKTELSKMQYNFKCVYKSAWIPEYGWFYYIQSKDLCIFLKNFSSELFYRKKICTTEERIGNIQDKLSSILYKT